MIGDVANGESGDNARKVAAMDLERGFVQGQMDHPVKKVSLVYLRKDKNARYGTGIVNQYQVLSLISTDILKYCVILEIRNLLLSTHTICCHMIGYDTYVQAKFDRGCCINSEVSRMHRRCICDYIHEKDQCQEICSNDTLCKGFVMLFQKGVHDPPKCNIATSMDECPINCTGPHNDDNIAPLDPDGQCGIQGLWKGGCYIKQGMYSKTSSVAFSMNEYNFRPYMMKTFNFY